MNSGQHKETENESVMNGCVDDFKVQILFAGSSDPPRAQLCSREPGLTAGCLGPALLLLLLFTGMELGPFREEVGVCVLLPLATAGGLLREEVGMVAVGLFHEEGEK